MPGFDNQRARVIAIGETTYDIRFREGKVEASAVGGSQLNSIVSLGRCGVPSLFVSSVGNDPIGDLSVNYLQENGVDTTAVARFEGNSRVALAFTDGLGNATYTIYPASQTLTPQFPLPRKGDLILFGSSFALRSHGREELLQFLVRSREAGAIVIYDPNIRASAREMPKLIRVIEENMAMSHLVKGSDEDFRMIYPGATNGEIYRRVAGLGVVIMALTKGAGGASLFTPNGEISLPSPPVKVVNTIGAGDNFSAGMIYGLMQNGALNSLGTIGSGQWTNIVEQAIDFASHVCSIADNCVAAEFAAEKKRAVKSNFLCGNSFDYQK